MLPYEKKGSLAWPQTRDIRLTGDLYVTNVGVKAGDGTASSPYSGLKMGASLAPAAWTIHISGGTYPGPITFSRAVFLLAQDGAVTIGQ
jgi:hypothetical protein